MQIGELNDKVEHLVSLRKQRDVILEAIDQKKQAFEKTIEQETKLLQGLRDEITTTQDQLVSVLAKQNLKQWKIDGVATVSRKTATSFKVVDIQKTIAKLKRMKLYDEYVRVTIAPQAKTLFEKTQTFPGVEREDKDYISVLTAKEKTA